MAWLVILISAKGVPLLADKLLGLSPVEIKPYKNRYIAGQRPTVE